MRVKYQFNLIFGLFFVLFLMLITLEFYKVKQLNRSCTVDRVSLQKNTRLIKLKITRCSYVLPNCFDSVLNFRS